MSSTSGQDYWRNESSAADHVRAREGNPYLSNLHGIHGRDDESAGTGSFSGMDVVFNHDEPSCTTFDEMMLHADDDQEYTQSSSQVDWLEDDRTREYSQPSSHEGILDWDTGEQVSETPTRKAGEKCTCEEDCPEGEGCR